MTPTDHLRVGVVGAGMMGADHIRRLAQTVAGAHVSAIIEPDEAHARAAAAAAPDAAFFTRIEDALDAQAMDAVIIATPGRWHEPVLLPVLEAKLPVLCEKPLTQDPESSLRIVEAEQSGGVQLIQVGFMRRFDREYEALRDLIAGGSEGELLMLHGVHRNPTVFGDYSQSMLITDSVVHEFDVLPWLVGGRIASIEVRFARRNSLAPEHLREPILVLMEFENGVLADVEMNVSAQFGYQVTTEAVFERGVARIGQPTGAQLWHEGRVVIGEHQSFTTRFRDAYDREVQAWVDGARRGRIAGPSAWDGYTVAVACAAGVRALETRGPVELELPEVPAFYAGA